MMKNYPEKKWRQAVGIVTGILIFVTPLIGHGGTDSIAKETAAVSGTLNTLESFIRLKNDLSQDIKTLNQQINAAQAEAEKKGLRTQLEKLEADLRTTTRNIEDVAAGVDISSLREDEQQEFKLQEEILALLKPALDEMKEITSHMRQKTDLKEKIAYYKERLPVIDQALDNIYKLQKKSESQPLNESLKATAESWKKKQAFMLSKLQAAQLQYDQLVASETSIATASHNYLKSFFQRRGLFLTEALLVVIGIILFSRMTYKVMARYIPGFRTQHRNFRIRLLELMHRMLTVLFVILGPMIVFYVVEDWVLFSLGLLLLLGIAWTLRQTVPRYWHQVQLFLNIGSVREGERILLEGLPWRVQQINLFCTLTNPVAKLTQRVPIDDLVDLKSRPSRPDEPWFPCEKDDWVILSDGVRGRVIGISPELVQLGERGGTQVTYQTSDFLSRSPRNLATSFRIKETIGISYALQKQATSQIPEVLHAYIQQRVAQEGYGDQLLNLRVEFAQANTSSLDIQVIADFKGELGDLYNRLRRSIQRWCVDACSENGWEIPFPQMTLHGTLNRAPAPND